MQVRIDGTGNSNFGGPLAVLQKFGELNDSNDPGGDGSTVQVLIDGTTFNVDIV